jgi:hypothetical protein
MSHKADRAGRWRGHHGKDNSESASAHHAHDVSLVVFVDMQQEPQRNEMVFERGQLVLLFQSRIRRPNGAERRNHRVKYLIDTSASHELIGWQRRDFPA